MKIDLNNVTVEQFMRFQLLATTYKDNENKLNTELIKYLYGDLSISKKRSDIDILRINEVLTSEPDFIQRFNYNGVEYGFIPKLDDISVGEFIDLDEYIKDGTQLHKIAAILYRPVIKSSGQYYDIEPYEGTAKLADIMRGVNYKVIIGALVFFYNLGNSLLKASATYTQNLIAQNKMKQSND